MKRVQILFYALLILVAATATEWTSGPLIAQGAIPEAGSRIRGGPFVPCAIRSDWAMVSRLLAATNVYETQNLRPVRPEQQSLDGINIYYFSFDKDMPASAAQTFNKLISERYGSFAPWAVQVSKIPEADNLYSVLMVGARGGLFLFEKKGETLVEAAREVIDVHGGGENMRQTFFVGRERTLIIATMRAGDGGVVGNFVFEYVGGRLKGLGGIAVSDRVQRENYIAEQSPIDRAVAEYKGNTYYVTLIGEGDLYSLDERDKKLASRRSPLTFYFDGKTWRRSERKRMSRK